MKKLLPLAATGILAATLPAQAAGILWHRYSFNDIGAVTDTAIGGSGPVANLIDGTLEGTATVAGGVLTTAGEGSGTAHAALPASVVLGLSGSFTIEQWFTSSGNTGGFQTNSSFSAPGGNNNGGSQADYVLGTPNRGSGTGDSSSSINLGGSESVLGGTTLNDGTQHMVATTYDAGTDAMTYYINGTAANSTTIADFDFSALTVVGINGRSPWPDASLNGSTDEFRIYEGALTDTEIAQNALDGPDATVVQFEANNITVPAIPEPTSTLLIGLAGGLLGLRRRRS